MRFTLTMPTVKSAAPVHLVSQALASCKDFGTSVDIDKNNVRQNQNGEWTVPLTNIGQNGVTRNMFDAVNDVCGHDSKLVVKNNSAYIVTSGYKRDQVRSRSQSPAPPSPESTSCVRLLLHGLLQCVLSWFLWILLVAIIVSMGCKKPSNLWIQAICESQASFLDSLRNTTRFY